MEKTSQWRTLEVLQALSRFYYLNSYSPIIHDLDEEKLYFAAHNEDQVHSSGHDIYAVNINNGTVAHTHRVGESVAFPFMIIGQI